MDKEITYIPYGQDEISQQDLMTSLANGAPGYLDSKRWAKKDKYRQAWLNAYYDIIDGGLVGASNSSGIWTIQHGGEPIDLNTKSNLEREMYQDAAYYIQQQMSRMTPRKKEEEAKKDTLDKYDFTSQFLPQIYNNRYGGNKDLFASEWENLDARGDNGLRGTDKRKAALIEELTKYKQNLLNNKGKYNFEGTAFKDENDVIGRIDEAIAAINSPDLADDNPKLNALGLSYNSFFSNGGNDIYGTDKDGQQVTYQQYYENLNKQNELDAKAKEEELKKRKQAAYNNTLFFNRVTNSKMMGQNAIALKEKYKDHNTLFNVLQGYAQKDIRTLSPQEQSEVQGAYRYLANQPIDATTLKNLQSSSSGLYKNAAPNRFRKIKGIDNLVWDSVGNQVIQITNRQQQEAIRNQPEDLFAGVQTKQDLENIPRGGGVQLTDADYRDIYATVADLGALINPEIFSGTAMALSASGARTWNSIEQRGVWDTLTDWKTWADWGTGALGGTALLGDASSAVKVVRGFGKLMTIPAIYQSLNSIPEAKAAWDKIDLSSPIESAKKLTPQDYHALSTFLMGIISGKNYLRGNLAERAVLKHSGVNTESKSKIREYSNKFGITRTKPQSQETVSTLKVKKTGKDGKTSEQDITITKEQKAAIQKAKPSEVEKAAKDAGVKIPEGHKVEVNKSKINAAKSYFGKGNSEVIGKKTQEASKGKDDFDNWLENRGIWNKVALGTNKNLRRVKQNLGISTTKQETSESKSETSQQGTTEQKTAEAPKTSSKISKEKVSKMRQLMDTKESVKAVKEFRKSTGNLSNLEVKPGKLQFGDVTIEVGSKVASKTSGNLEKVKKLREAYKNKMEQQLSNPTSKTDLKAIRKSLIEARKLGWWKQGGTINTSLDNIIEDFFKNNNI